MRKSITKRYGSTTPVLTESQSISLPSEFIESIADGIQLNLSRNNMNVASVSVDIDVNITFVPAATALKADANPSVDNSIADNNA